MKYPLLIVPIIAAVLSACDPESERDCGVFDHPELALWQSEDIETQAQFVSSDGTMANFERQAVVLNEAFLGADGASNDEDVICELTATVRLQSSDATLAIESIFIQRERLPLDSDDEALFIDHSIEVPSGTVLPDSFLADISVARTRINLAPSRIEYVVAEVEEPVEGETETETDTETDPDALEMVVIGGQTYEDVVRIGSTLAPADDDTTQGAGPISSIREVVVARNFGIVAFTDDQNREFVRVPTQ